MAATIKFVVSGRQYEFEKSQASQGIRNLVLGIKKAAPLREADKEFDYIQYTTKPAQPARLFDKYKDRLRHMLIGYKCSAALEWDRLPDEQILDRIGRYKEYAKMRQNAFYIGVALYGLKVVCRRRVAA